MKKLLILGAGTAGTMVANRMSNMLDRDEWRIIIVDRDQNHYYQPGFLFIPFGIYGKIQRLVGKHETAIFAACSNRADSLDTHLRLHDGEPSVRYVDPPDRVAHYRTAHLLPLRPPALEGGAAGRVNWLPCRLCPSR